MCVVRTKGTYQTFILVHINIVENSKQLFVLIGMFGMGRTRALYTVFKLLVTAWACALYLIKYLSNNNSSIRIQK